jgi:hypothetical protein
VRRLTDKSQAKGDVHDHGQYEISQARWSRERTSRNSSQRFAHGAQGELMSVFDRTAAAAVAAILSTAWLAGCGSDTKVVNCPSAAALAPTSTLTAFQDGAAKDPADAVYTVGLVNVKTDCSFDSDAGTTDSTLELTFRAKRKDAGKAAAYKVPYFVAVTQGTRILSKRIFWVNFGFSSGESTTEFRDSVGSTLINLENGKKPYEYELLTGLQLTHDQLEYNKSIGRYAL